MNSFANSELSDIIAAIKSSSSANSAFAELEARYMPLMSRRVAMYFDTSANTSEEMQEARIALHKAALTYDSEKCDGVTFGLYASICIANKLRSLLRSRASMIENESQLVKSENLVSGVDIEASIAARDIAERVMKVARSVLSDYEYEVFRLTFERYATRDIAAKLERSAKSVDNAKNRIARTLRANREILDILSDIY